MKKGLVALLVVSLLVVGGIYIFIPAQLAISRVVFVNANASAAYRCLTDENKWATWWPGTIVSGATGVAKNFEYNKIAFQVGQTSINAVGVRVRYKKNQDQSILQTIKYGADSTALQWTCTLKTGSDPFTRIATYHKALVLKNSMDTILKNMKSFLSKTENVYGIAIAHVMIKDSTLVTTRYFSTSYPGTETIYGLIKGLRQYAAQHGAQEMNYPMLHVQEEKEQGRFETMVALPVNKELKGNASIVPKRMQVHTMLATDVYGGRGKIKNANVQLENYLNDHRLFSPAIAYESLVTDRLAERDTSNWITKVYLPVMVFEVAH